MYHVSDMDEDYKIVIEIIAVITALVLVVFALLRWS